RIRSEASPSAPRADIEGSGTWKANAVRPSEWMITFPSRICSVLGKSKSDNLQPMKAPKKSTSDLACVAHHEAGHVIADWRFGRRLKKATIIPRGDYLGSVTATRKLHLRSLEYTDPSPSRTGRLHALVIALFAGIAAQRRFNPRSCRSYHGGSDNE